MPGVPFDRSAIALYDSRADWARVGPSLVAERLDRWKLRPGATFPGGAAGIVLAVETAYGLPAVLKVGFPHFEALWEPVALAAFGSERAPGILEQDAGSWSLLLERVTPGAPLSHAGIPPETAMRIGGELLGDLAGCDIPPGLPSLTRLVSAFVRTARADSAGQEASLGELGVADAVADGIGLLARLAADDVVPALIHGDYNPGNILDAGDGRWRVIDPKPVSGDPAYDLWPLVTQLGSPGESMATVAQLEARLLVAAESAGVDAGRATLWAFARAALGLTWLLAESGQAEPDRAELRREARLVSAWAELAGR